MHQWLVTARHTRLVPLGSLIRWPFSNRHSFFTPPIHPSARSHCACSCVHTRISASHSAIGDAVTKGGHTTCTTVVLRALPSPRCSLATAAPARLAFRFFPPARHCFILYTTVRHACTLFHAAGRPLTLARTAAAGHGARLARAENLGKNCWKNVCNLLVDNSITLVQLQAQQQASAQLSSHQWRPGLRAARIGWAARK